MNNALVPLNRRLARRGPIFPARSLLRFLHHAAAPLVVAGAGLTLGLNVSGQGTAFSYQGRLTANGSPVNGAYDLQFQAYDSPVEGVAVGPVFRKPGVGVTNGLFAVDVDLGPNVFSGPARWLEVGARASGGTDAYAIITPRTLTTATPYAIRASSAVTVADGVYAAANQTFTGVNAFNNPANAFSGRFSGDAKALTNLNAASLTGTVPVERLPLRGAGTGGWPNSILKIENTSGDTNASPALRLVGDGGSTGDGVLNVSANGTGLIARFGNANNWVADITTNGTVHASAFVGDGSQLTGVTTSDARTLGGAQGLVSGAGVGGGVSANTNVTLNSNPVYLRNDQNHGLAYNGNGITNFPSPSVQPDGPVLWGYGGGALAVMSGGPKSILAWDSGNVSVNNNANLNVSGNLSARNTPGVNWNQNDSETIAIGDGQGVIVGSEGNFKPAPGFFVIMASAVLSFDSDIMDDYHGVGLRILDVTTSPPVWVFGYNSERYSVSEGHRDLALSFSCVVPITSPGGYQNFALQVQAFSGTATCTAHSLTVMYFPRQNN